MNLEDAMLEAILRDVLANPGEYPGTFVRDAQHFSYSLERDEYHGLPRWPASYQRWLEVAKEFLENRRTESK